MTKKTWNWEQEGWPNFAYKQSALEQRERVFLSQSGLSLGISKYISKQEKKEVTIQLLSNEAFKTSLIEGELLDRESLQSSIKRHFGYKTIISRNHPKESGITEMMMDLYHNHSTPLTHETLCQWHDMIMNGRRDIENIGQYRTHVEPMQIVSGHIGKTKVHFEAPPSSRVEEEMNHFIMWFNESASAGKSPLPSLIRAGIAHLYFVSIHPFEDGNGRIGRALVEKVLAQSLGRPTLIALSQVIQDNKKAYYMALEEQSTHNDIDEWLDYFSSIILEAQEYAINEIEFLVKKAKFYDRYKDQLNQRQQKVIARIFVHGSKGFAGGLSAKNYISITRTSPSTATRDLQYLVKKKIFTQTGRLKSTRYWLNVDNK